MKSNALVSEDSSLNYRRIRAPKDHGQVLHSPGADLWDELWKSNCSCDYSGANFHSGSIAKLKELAFKEFTDLALSYTQQYRDVDLSKISSDHIVMGGHQPGLFHPGVWYKNFVLSGLGQRFNATAINLVVDNDNCHSVHINVPANELSESRYYFKRIPFDDPGINSPFECRKIINRRLFKDFRETVERQVDGFVDDPIISKLWPYVLENSENDLVGRAICQGRHRLEQDYEVQTLELPISLVASTDSFAFFVKEVLTRHRDLFLIYNDTIQVYRKIHKIKNAAQPLPELRRFEDWYETPFWIWTKDSSRRRSLYAKVHNSKIYITDLESFETQLTADSSTEELRDIINNGQSIRPKALMTTLFHRLLACDLFIHGIGGSKYDQLTDEIAKRFFGVELPDYLTISGTYKIGQHNAYDETRIPVLKRQLRSLKYHPEKHIDKPNSDAAAWIQQKRQWIERKLPLGQRMPRHTAIDQANLELQQFVANEYVKIQAQLLDATKQYSNSKVIDSREFSFCIHGTNLIDSLKTEFRS